MKTLSTLFILALAVCASAAEPPKLDLRIDREGWGSANTRDAEAVFRSAAAQLLPYFPGVELPPIRVSPKGGPIVLHRRAEDGAVIMRLNTGDTYWSQYAYQFSHELCHVLCRYDEDPTGNGWFEESVCELASLYALRAMGRSWQVNPPYRNWKDYAGKLTEYAQKRIDEAALPAEKTLAEWYRENAAELRNNATDRPRNTVVAAALLPLFESQPRHWAAVWHLNEGKVLQPQPFDVYLRDWHGRVPSEHRAFVQAIARQFGLTLAEP